MDVKCPLCAVVMEEQAEEDCLACPRCLTRARFHGEELEALNIPGIPGPPDGTGEDERGTDGEDRGGRRQGGGP